MSDRIFEEKGGDDSETRYLAVDLGGSHSHALLVEGERVLDSRTGGAANLYTHGPQAVAAEVAALARLLPSFRAVALSVAGGRTREDLHGLVRAVGEAGVDVPVAAYPDVRAALAAAGVSQGIVVVAGTGSAAYGRAADGREARAGGWGGLLGDEGGAFWIVRETLRAVVRASDEGDERLDPVGGALLEALGMQATRDLRRLASAPDVVARLAASLPAVATWWKEKPEVFGIVERAVDELARLARLAAGELALTRPVSVVAHGGVFRAIPELASMLAERLGAGYSVDVLDRDPALGALALAQEENAWIESFPVPAGRPAGEESDPRLVDLDRRSTMGILEAMNEADAEVAGVVRRCLPQIAELVEAVVGAREMGGRLIYVGAGTSGRLAMLDAVECVPTFGVDPSEVVALIAGGNAALTRAVEGAEDDAEAGAEAIREIAAAERDVVVGVSASGGAAYVRAAAEEAERAGAYTAFLTCRAHVAVPGRTVIRAVVGPEVVTGSSRLKAGTAQKLILNMISTCAMVRSGRTLGNRMAAVRPTNRKLRERATRLVMEMADVSAERARTALEESDWDVALASLGVVLGSAEQAREEIQRHGGNIATALRAHGIGQ